MTEKKHLRWDLRFKAYILSSRVLLLSRMTEIKTDKTRGALERRKIKFDLNW